MKNSKFLLVLALLCYTLLSCNRTENSFNRNIESKLVEKTINNSIG